MGEVSKLSNNPPSEVWARSLRQETALQDQYRRAIYDGHGGMSTAGFDRWNAAQCLQEQVDAARGVEHTKGLAKSRAIITHFARRSTMKDMQGTDLCTVRAKSDIRSSSPATRVAEHDSNLTRKQVLNLFGIDLGHVGVKTSARTTSRQSFDACDVGCSTNNTANPEETNGTGKGNAKKDRRRSTIPTTNDNTATDVAGKSHNLLSEKLEFLDKLLSDELPLAGNGDVGDIEDGARADKGQDDPALVVREKDGSGEKRSSGSVVDLSGGADETLEPLKDDSLVNEAPSDEACARNTGSACVDIIAAESLQVGHGRREINAAKIIEAVLHEKSRPKGTSSTGPRQFHDKALPNHRPCWWWTHLFPPEVKGICIPDTVFSASMPLSPRPGGSHTATTPAAGDDPDYVSSGRKNERPSYGRPREQCLLWAFSRAEDLIDDKNVAHHCAETGLRAGVEVPEEGGGRAGTPAVLSPSAIMRASGGRHFFTEQTSPPPQRPPVQHRLYTKTVRDDEDLLRIAEAICECGRRGQTIGRGGGGGSGAGSTLKLPLALLKIWCRQSNEEKRHSSRSSGAHKNSGTPRGGRQLRVISLWTEPEVLEALQDMFRGRWCQRYRRKHSKQNVDATKKVRSVSLGELPSSSPERETPPPKTLSASSSAGARTSPQPVSSLSAASGGGTSAAKRWEQPSKSFPTAARDGDACCVQAFTKGASFLAPPHSQPRPSPSGDETSGPSIGVSHGSSRTRVSTASGSPGNNKGQPTPHDDVLLAATRGARETCRDGGERVPKTAARDENLASPVFYRVAWRRGGEKHLVWKIRSRYPYVSNLSAHLCPLARAGSAAPFTATAAEEKAAVLAAAKTGIVAQALREAYDPTLQRLWADWVVNREDGQWILIEVHGIKTDADVRSAAGARASLPAFAKVESKVHTHTHRIPPSHFCGDPADLEARTSAAHPTEELPLVEVSKRAAALTPGRQRSKPSKVSESTRNVLLLHKGDDWRRGKAGNKPGSGGKSRRMVHQYWRCAGDFCEIHPGGNRRATPAAINDGSNSVSAEARTAEGAEVRSSDASGSQRTTGAGPEEDEIIGKRKHALAVETPRTVLFRLVLNARAALLGWRPSAIDFSNMDKPVQLCSACYVVCDTLERERTEKTRRAMDAEDQAVRACKARRNRKPPGWKSRLQHELEDTLRAERDVVSGLVDSFENATANAAATGECKGRLPSASSSKRCAGVHGGTVRDVRGGRSWELGVEWADSYPMVEAHSEGGNTTHSKTVQVVERGFYDDAESMPRREVRGTPVDGAARTTSSAERAQRIKRVPLPPGSSLPRKKQGSLAKAPALVVADAKQTLETEKRQQPRESGSKKREVRARRRAKEKARRHLHHSVVEDVADAGNSREKSSRDRTQSRTILGRNKGKAESLAHEETLHNNDFLQVLQPQAPRIAKHGSDVHIERAERSECVSIGQRCETTSLEGRGTSFCKDGVSIEAEAIIRRTEANRPIFGGPKREHNFDTGVMAPDIAVARSASLRGSNGHRQQHRKEDCPGMLLRPTAPTTQGLGNETYRVKDDLGRQGRGLKGVASIPTASAEELAGPEYGEEDFEVE